MCGVCGVVCEVCGFARLAALLGNTTRKGDCGERRSVSLCYVLHFQDSVKLPELGCEGWRELCGLVGTGEGKENAVRCSPAPRDHIPKPSCSCSLPHMHVVVVLPCCYVFPVSVVCLTPPRQSMCSGYDTSSDIVKIHSAYKPEVCLPSWWC